MKVIITVEGYILTDEELKALDTLNAADSRRQITAIPHGTKFVLLKEFVESVSTDKEWKQADSLVSKVDKKSFGVYRIERDYPGDVPKLK